MSDKIYKIKDDVIGVTIIKGVTELQVNILDFDKKTVTYEVKNTPICQYDQHSRARIGVRFFDYKVTETPEYVFYTQVFNLLSDEQFRTKVFSTLTELENIRIGAKFKTPFNLMTRNCSYKVQQDYTSLKGQMMRRLKFCEEEFIVGLHWLLREKMIQQSKLIMLSNGPMATQLFDMATSFLPGCDLSESCDYASADYLSNMFGCLFAGCGRWEGHAQYASFNQSCTTPEILEEQLGIKIPRSKHELLHK